MLHPTLTIERVAEGFALIQDWDQRYQFIIDLGAKLSPMDEDAQTEHNRVQGCMSKVWISAQRDPRDAARIVLQGESETSTVKGIVAILVAVYSGKTPAEIQGLDADAVFDGLGLFDHLSPTRHVGVYAMVEHIKQRSAEAATGDCVPSVAASASLPSGALAAE